ncbi:MAG: tetratricopeptide repeat protein [Holophagaceae bacterium]|nr:tetratricopeptide repeat protein [Holophagaceae bacterium]
MSIDRAKVTKEADKLLAAGRIGKAIEEYRKLLDDNPKDLPLMNRIGDLCVQAKRIGEAIDIFKRLGMTYERDGFTQKGIAVLKKATRLAPDDLDMSGRLADMYRQVGMIKDALQVHLSVAEFFTKKGLIKRALEEFAKVVELDPKNLKNKVKLADLYNKEGMKDRAASIYLEVAEALAIEQMHTEANQILERAKAMVSTPQVFLTQSRLAVIQKDLSAAASHLREGLKANPRSNELLEALAEIEIQSKNPDRALEALGQIPQLPEKALQLCERGLRDLVKANRTEEGLRLFKPIGREFARRGMGDNAAKALKNALQGNWSSEAYIQLAEIAHQSGNRREQGAALQNAFSLATQQRDQNLATHLGEQLRTLGLNPGEAPDSPPSTPGMPAYASSMDQTHGGGRPGDTTEMDPVKQLQIQQLVREADAHTRSKSTDRAVEAYKKILELDPAFDIAIDKIAEIHKASGILSRVQMHYVQTAQILVGKGFRNKAIELLDRAEQMFPGSTRLHRRTLGLLDAAAPVIPDAPPAFAPQAPAPAPVPPQAQVIPRPDPFAMAPPPMAESIALGPPPSESLAGVPLSSLLPPEIAAAPELSPEMLIPLDVPGSLPGIVPVAPPPPPYLEPAAPLAPFSAGAGESIPLNLPAPTDSMDFMADLDLSEAPSFSPEGSSPFDFIPPEPEAPAASPETEALDFLAPSAALPTMPMPIMPMPGEVSGVGGEPPTLPGFLSFEELPSSISATGPVVDGELASLLSDIDFQMDYGSPDEAKEEIETALQQYQDHPELLARLHRAEESLRKIGLEAKSKEADDFSQSFFDLTDVLGDALLETGEGEEMHDATNVVEKVQSVDELFSAFRDGVEKQVQGDDYDTHYNLGIAYKEMMLLEPAIEEFKKAMADPERTQECCSMLSICELELGNQESAIEWLNQGIHAPGFPPEDSIGLRYDLGELFLSMGRPAEAKTEFTAVHELDPEYREVAARLG